MKAALRITCWGIIPKKVLCVAGTVSHEHRQVYRSQRASNLVNTGIPVWRVQRIKDHVFNNEHILEYRTGKFAPDYEIAQAWKRLENGTSNLNDIDLLNHEIFESKFEGIFKSVHCTSHDKTVELGRTWGPDKWND